MHSVLISLLTLRHVQAIQVFEYSDPHEISKSMFEKHVLNGDVVVIRQSGASWSLTKVQCDEYRTKELEKFSVERVYGESDGAFVGLCQECESFSGDKRRGWSKSYSEYSPLYWEIRDNVEAASWVSERIQLWDFLSDRARALMWRAMEIWFSPPKSGASSHMDSHVQSTIVTQLAGNRIWRLGKIPRLTVPTLARHFGDHQNFEWTVDAEIHLNSGDSLMFPPGTIHETHNPSESVCAASLTMQVLHPLPTAYYRRSLEKILFNYDLSEIWPVVRSLVSDGIMVPIESKTAPYFTLAGGDMKEPGPNRRYTETEVRAYLSAMFVTESATLGGESAGPIPLSELSVVALKEFLDLEDKIFSSLPESLRPARYFRKSLGPALQEDFLRHSDLVSSILVGGSGLPPTLIESSEL